MRNHDGAKAVKPALFRILQNETVVLEYLVFLVSWNISMVLSYKFLDRLSD